MNRAPFALVAGALLPLSMAPFHFYLLGPVALALYFLVLFQTRSRGILVGWLYGLGLYGVGTSWIYVSIHEHGGAPPLLAGSLVVLFSAGMALFPMLHGWLFCRFKPTSPVRAAVLFAVLYLALEWLVSWFLTGFPWVAAGYGQIESALAAFAPVGGVALVSFLVVFVGLVLALIILTLQGGSLRSSDSEAATALPGGSLRPIRLGILVGLLIGPWILGLLFDQIYWTRPAAQRQAALVQGNIEQASKWDPDNRLPILRRYQELTEPHWGADLILWPEAAITVFEHQAEELLSALDVRGKSTGSGLVLGLPAVEAYPGGDYRFLNTARGLGTAQGRYVKRRLVPFGEYVPLEDLLRGLIQFFDLPMSQAEAGPWTQKPLQIGDATASMAICYEIVYPELVREEVDVLLTISNDTWFGDSIGPDQHLAIARMRALENGRWLLRATNSGITAIIDARGVVRAELPQFEPGVLTGGYQEMAGRTPFNRFGSWPLYALLLAAAGALAFRKAQK